MELQDIFSEDTDDIPFAELSSDLEKDAPPFPFRKYYLRFNVMIFENLALLRMSKLVETISLAGKSERE